MTKTCDYCGVSFEATRANQRFCSNCRGIKNIDRKTASLNKKMRKKAYDYLDYAKGFKFTCEQCGKQFNGDATLFKVAYKFCGPQCKRKWKAEHKDIVDGHTYICKNCGNILVDYRKAREFCNSECRKEYRERIERNSMQECSCLNCGKTFKHDIRRPNPKYFCSNECRLKMALHDDRFLHKDECVYTCQHCGKKFIGKKSPQRKYCSNTCKGLDMYHK